MSGYLKEAEELEKRWANATKNYSPYGEYNRSAVDTLLENQRLMNENRNPVPEVGEFKRINIPLVRRLVPQMNDNLRPTWWHGTQNPCHEIPLGPQEECVLPVPVKKRKKVLRSIDDEWES